MASVHHLRAGGVSLVVDTATLPRILYWGADLGDLPDAELAALAGPAGGGDPQLCLLPQNADGWCGTPGLSGHRDGRDFSALFHVERTARTDSEAATRLTVTAADRAAGLALELVLELTRHGLVRTRASLEALDPVPYTVDGLSLALPVPDAATELLTLGGHHARERTPWRGAFTHGTHVRESRRGRPGLDASLLFAAGEPGFGFRRGQVWAMHVAWSGNHKAFAELQPSGARVLGGGELLLPGEIRLGQGERYQTPWVYFSYGIGLDQVAARFHAHRRARPPVRSRPRPVTGNAWEAVYFHHDEAELTALAEAFAEVGVERFVLDDGWFRHRRHDHAGLGDWYVDETVWPRGLHPLFDRVRELGLEVGLWVEPEMVNPDSDLARAHPDWILAARPGRLPVEERHQQVLNLTVPAAYDYIAGRLDALVDEYRLDYLKWDHNRDLVEPGTQATRRPAVHGQTEAVYRLIGELKSRHPGLEIETCASGGGRTDLGILELTDRLWTSDCTDAHERAQIQRYTGLLVPPELMGAHISASPNHQTGRRLSLTARAVVALFGDLGVEWNVAAASGAERAELAGWIALYKRWRGLLHHGTVVHADHPDPSTWVNGVVAADGERGLFAVVPLETTRLWTAGRICLPGLTPQARYRVELVEEARAAAAERIGWGAPAWLTEGVVVSGAVLGAHGLGIPQLQPDVPLLISAVRVS